MLSDKEKEGINNIVLNFVEHRNWTILISDIESLLMKKKIMTWNPCDYETGEGMPETAGSYFVCRKDGKIHKENYNGTGWAYNSNSIIYWTKIVSPL